MHADFHIKTNSNAFFAQCLVPMPPVRTTMNRVMHVKSSKRSWNVNGEDTNSTSIQKERTIVANGRTSTLRGLLTSAATVRLHLPVANYRWSTIREYTCMVETRFNGLCCEQVIAATA